jgi:hypothetical protein
MPSPTAYDRLMDTVIIYAAASAVLAKVDWGKVMKGLATDAASKSAKGLLGRFKPDEREKAAKHAVGLLSKNFSRNSKTKLRSQAPSPAITTN